MISNFINFAMKKKQETKRKKNLSIYKEYDTIMEQQNRKLLNIWK
jgi:hypothetical protein